MSIEDWDFYLCVVEGGPASIAVDLNATHRRDCPFNYVFSFAFQQPDPGGFWEPAESESLRAADRHIKQALAQAGLVVVGRLSGLGGRRYYAYGPDDGFRFNVPDPLFGAAGRYPVSTEVFLDSAWGQYHDFLYPNEMGFRSIKNRHKLEGSNWQTALQAGQTFRFTHWVRLPTEADAVSFATGIAQATGAAIEDIYQHGVGDLTWTVEFVLTHPMDPSVIDKTCHISMRIAQINNGTYDDWESEPT